MALPMVSSSAPRAAAVAMTRSRGWVNQNVRRQQQQQRRWCVGPSSFTHVSPEDSSKPSMVDVSTKRITMRQAIAEAVVETDDAAAVVAHEKVLKAAAVTGAVNCYKTIPFCHPLDPVSVELAMRRDGPRRVVILVTATTNGKTGVEMEALAGAAFAAVTAQTVVRKGAACAVARVLLRHKTGGKSGSVTFDDDARLVA